MYYNEKGVGDAVRTCSVPREELFITTKICDSCYTKEETLRTVDHSLKQLGLDYVDLMLIHWPVGNPTVGRNVTGWPSDALRYEVENTYNV